MATDFGNFIRIHRKKLNISQRKLAKIVGISYTYVSSLETGKRPTPSPDVLKRITKTLKLTPQEEQTMNHLAAKTKPVPTISHDLADYINKNDCVYNVLSFAQERGVKEADWQEFSDMIRNKY